MSFYCLNVQCRKRLSQICQVGVGGYRVNFNSDWKGSLTPSDSVGIRQLEAKLTLMLAYLRFWGKLLSFAVSDIV